MIMHSAHESIKTWPKTHWLAITRKRPLAPIIKHIAGETREKTVASLNLSRVESEKLLKDCHVTIPRKAFVELVTCDCEDGSHKEELR